MKRCLGLALILTLGVYGQTPKGGARGGLRPDAAGNYSIGATLPVGAPANSLAVGGAVFGTPRLMGQAGSLLGIYPSPTLMRPDYPKEGLVALYDLTGLAGGATSVTNGVSDKPALTLVGGPTIASDGVTFAGEGQYAVSASALTDIDMTKDWAVIVAGTFNGGAYSTIVNLGSTADNVNYHTASIAATPGWAYAESRNDTGAASSPIQILSTPMILSLMARWGNVGISRIDNGQSFSTPNDAPSGDATLSLGCQVRQQVYNCGSTLTVRYVMVWSRSLVDAEIKQANDWITSRLALKGVSTPTYKRVPPVYNLPSNGLAQAPPMGWSSWHLYGANISDAAIRSQADALVSSGMASVGYKYINLDHGWMNGRDGSGNALADATKFPSGLKALGDYIHSRGLKFGLYSGVGVDGTDQTGVYGHELQDAFTYAYWGADYFKFDWVNANSAYTEAFTLWGAPVAQAVYQRMALALRATGRPIVYSIVPPTTVSAHTWAAASGANLWRYSADISADWTGINAVFDLQTGLAPTAGPGHWNDPDMIVCGLGSITDDECKTQMSLWSLLAAPLLASNDLTNMTAATKAALTNADVIAVDQDALGVQGVKVSSASCGSATCEVWARQLSDGACAIGAFNRDSAAHDVTITFADVASAVSACGSGPYAVTKNLWTGASLGTLTTSHTAAAVPAHGVFLMRVK